RDKEQITTLNLLQESLTVVSFTHCITEQPAEPIQQARLHQEVLHVFWLPQENFFNQVVHHIAMRTGEGGDEVGHILAVLQGEGCQVQPRDPTFSTCQESS